MYKHIALFLSIGLFFSGCSGIERSENEKIRKRNCHGEYIYRKHNEYTYVIMSPAHTPREPYPWEGNHPRITKDFFRCKGSVTHPPVLDSSDPTNLMMRADCDGRHGLPVIHGEEGVYPVLIELLNEIQKQTEHRVIITSGHRCPAHNSYVNPSKENKTSKHQIGAEVDFYVQGMEESPLEIVQIILNHYKTDSLQQRENVWMNREILIKVSKSQDFDNQHPYTFLTIQVRTDRTTQERVSYEWKKAHLDYPH